MIDFVDFLAEREERKLVESAVKLSEEAFGKVWDNDEDSVYDDQKLRNLIQQLIG